MTNQSVPSNGHPGLQDILVDQITPWRAGQMRKIFDPVKLQELADSIEEKGVLQPILIRPIPDDEQGFKLGRKGESFDVTPFEIVAGERRWRASKLAKQATIPAIVRNLSDKEAIEIQVIENLQRADLSPIEEAEGYKRLLEDHGYTADTLAARLGKSKSYVYGRLKLCALPPAAMDAMVKGDLLATVGELIGRLPSMELRQKFWDDWYEEYGREDFDMPSFRDVKERIEDDYMRELKSAPWNKKDSNLVAAAGACVNCPKMTGNNRAEYPDGRADVCTDVRCFNEKLRAHYERQVEKAEKGGARVLSEADSAKLFNRYGDSTYLTSEASQKYVELKDQPWLDKEKRSWKQLLDGHVETVVATDPLGKPYYLAPKAEAERVLKEVHGIKPESVHNFDSHKASEKKRQDEKKIRQATVAEIVTRTLADVDDELFNSTKFLRIVAKFLIDNGGADVARAIAKRRQIEYDPNHVRGSVEKIVDGLDDADVPGLVLECLIQGELEFWAAWGGDRGDKYLLSDYFGLKPSVVMKQVAAKRKQESKAKAKPKAKAKAAATA